MQTTRRHPCPLQKMNSPLRQSCTASHWLHFTARSAGVKLGADEKFRAEKIPPEEAMIQAGRLRLRPIMVTALAAVASMLPWGRGTRVYSDIELPISGLDITFRNLARGARVRLG
jgi:hypothetical protein